MSRKLAAIFIAMLMMLSFSSCMGITVRKEVKPLIYGKWATKGGAMFEFTEDGRYAFYKDKNDTSDYYYKGPLKFLRGKAAMKDVNLTDEEFNRVYKKFTKDKNNIYSMKLYFETLHSEGKDKSKAADKGDYLYYLFVISSDDADKGMAIRLTDSYVSDITRIK